MLRIALDGVAARMSAGLDRRGLAVLASGHACADMAQGAVPALLPFLIDQRGISYGAAGALILVTSVGSSAIQPLFGLGSDRLALPWLMPLGVLLAGLGIALVGVTLELRGHRRRGGAQRPRRRRPSIPRGRASPTRSRATAAGRG